MRNDSPFSMKWQSLHANLPRNANMAAAFKSAYSQPQPEPEKSLRDKLSEYYDFTNPDGVGERPFGSRKKTPMSPGFVEVPDSNHTYNPASTAAAGAADPEEYQKQLEQNLYFTQQQLTDLQNQAAAAPSDKQIEAALEAAQAAYQNAYTSFQANAFPDYGVATSETYNATNVQKADVGNMQTDSQQMINANAGQIAGAAPTAQAGQAGDASRATSANQTQANTYQSQNITPEMQRQLDQQNAAQGNLSSQSQVQAAQGQISPEAIAQAFGVDPEYVRQVMSGERTVTQEELAEAAGQDEVAPAVQAAQSQGIDPVVAEQGIVKQEELPEAAQIAEGQMAQAQAIASGGVLNQDATAVAARMDKFNVDDGTLAEAMQGEVNALSTVQGQLSSLMQDFNDGTPAWAAGAIRAANGAMQARGLGASSMAGAAITQAAMESAIPIAAQDAQTFAQMGLANLNNQQQVALSNAAAQQGLSLQNLNNEQQAALQNSVNAFSLQQQDLSNMQSVIVANAQIKASLQGQNLSNQQQSNMAVAARYAESAKMNLNNRQQTALQNNANNLQIDMANLSNRQQAYVANAQLEAALQGQRIENQQQVAIANAARYSEAANLQFSAEEQAKLHNSELMKTIGLAELNNKQAVTLQNATQIANMDMANLNNRQQAQVQNANSFLQMDMQNLSNDQQMQMFKSQALSQSLLSDQAAENAAKQFNAASENQVDQFFADLSSRTSQFNADQQNAIKMFNAGEAGATERFNAQQQTARDQFNAQNHLIVQQANAQWRQTIATTEFQAQQQANMEYASTANAFTTKALDEIWQRERDIMSFAWQSSENAAERAMNLLIADKQGAAAKALLDKELEAADNAAMGAMTYDVLFGSGGGSSGGGLIGGLF